MNTREGEVELPHTITTRTRSIQAEEARSAILRWLPRLFWLGLAIAVVVVELTESVGWDAGDYYHAVFQHGAGLVGQSAGLPYSPIITIPVLRTAHFLPIWATCSLFVLAYVTGYLTQIWVGLQLACEDERSAFGLLAPAFAFFPGFLESETLLCGNVVYILYGPILAGAFVGWKRGRWLWFYLAVLAAACFKWHLLFFLAIPLLCAKRQWLSVCATGAATVALYAIQPWLWPLAFQPYLNTMVLLSGRSKDFGCGPAGMLARMLHDLGLPYSMPATVFYLAFASIMLGTLFYLAGQFRQQRISFNTWMPVMLLGVFLLNPRIMDYDLPVMTLPMALVAWRFFLEIAGSRRGAAISSAVLFLGLNLFLAGNGDWWPWIPHARQDIEMFLMLGIFASGVWGLLREAEFELLTSPTYRIESTPESEMA